MLGLATGAQGPRSVPAESTVRDSYLLGFHPAEPATHEADAPQGVRFTVAHAPAREQPVLTRRLSSASSIVHGRELLQPVRADRDAPCRRGSNLFNRNLRRAVCEQQPVRLLIRVGELRVAEP